MSQSVDPFEMYDGAYVLGALSDDDRRAYEAHLATCDACAASVRDLQVLPQALASVSPSVLDDEPPPASLLPALERRVRRERNRRHWILSGLTAAAAACIAAVILIATRPDQPSHHPVAMQAVSNAPIKATAEVRSVGWGTRIEVECKYYEAQSETRSYAVVVVPRHGQAEKLGSWNLLPGKTADYETGTSMPIDQIASVQITSVDGQHALLALNL
ncbi:MAG TPA: zf-HC2 domain-containing protein [Jatrophihabitantaceae bacterium]|jgi:anti-sigma-K factor RskA